MDITKMSLEEFRFFLRYTEEGKNLKKKAMEAFNKSQENKNESGENV